MQVYDKSTQTNLLQDVIHVTGSSHQRICCNAAVQQAIAGTRERSRARTEKVCDGDKASCWWVAALAAGLPGARVLSSFRSTSFFAGAHSKAVLGNTKRMLSTRTSCRHGLQAFTSPPDPHTRQLPWKTPYILPCRHSHLSHGKAAAYKMKCYQRRSKALHLPSAVSKARSAPAFSRSFAQALLSARAVQCSGDRPSSLSTSA